MKAEFFSKMRIYGRKRYVSGLLGLGILFFLNQGCITPKSQPLPAPNAPPLTFVPHPEGWDQIDLLNIFKDPRAPNLTNFSQDCDALYQKLRAKAPSKDELFRGVGELIKTLPVQFHWCFYAKLWLLEDRLSRDTYLDEGQKEVLSHYEFLVPVAKTFAAEYHDSRYLRWAIYRYQKYSERYFLRSLELTPEGTLELVQSSNPLNPFRDTKAPLPVLEKYQLMPDVKTATLPTSEVGLEKDLLEERTPDLSQQPYPTPIPTLTPTSLPSPESTVFH